MPEDKQRDVAEALADLGLVRVVPPRSSEDRAARYDALAAAEQRAREKKLRLHSGRAPPPGPRVADLVGDARRARAFPPALPRAATVRATVEAVFSGSRVKLRAPAEGCAFVVKDEENVAAVLEKVFDDGTVEEVEDIGALRLRQTLSTHRSVSSLTLAHDFANDEEEHRDELTLVKRCLGMVEKPKITAALVYAKPGYFDREGPSSPTGSAAGSPKTKKSKRAKAKKKRPPRPPPGRAFAPGPGEDWPRGDEEIVVVDGDATWE